MIRVGMFGTFDIGNFGDLLFPIVAERKLAQLSSVEMVRFSYLKKTAADWCYDVEPVETLPDVIGGLNLAMIGGGHLIHLNRRMAHGYQPENPAIPHPLGFWWLPAVTAAAANVPVAVHGVSSDAVLPHWATPLLETFVGASDYLTVRDEGTAVRLSRYCPDGRTISIVPDSIFSIGDILKRGDPSPQFEEFCRRSELKAPYLIVQPSDALWRRKASISDYLRQARVRGWEVIELPIGAGIGNYTGFYKEHVTVRPTKWPEPMLLAEIIANSEAVLGVSLHLSVVASCYGIPVYRPRYARSSKFVVLDDLPNIHFLEDEPPLQGRGETVPDLDLIDQYRAKLDEHWQRLVDLANRSNPPEPIKARGAWNQLCLTPEAFRQLRSRSDRWFEMKQAGMRQRQFLMHSVRRLRRSKSTEC